MLYTMNIVTIANILYSHEMNTDTMSIIFDFCGDIKSTVIQDKIRNFYGIYRLNLYGWTVNFEHHTAYYCSLCRLLMEKHYKLHVKGVKHKKKVQKDKCQIIDLDYIKFKVKATENWAGRRTLIGIENLMDY